MEGSTLRVFMLVPNKFFKINQLTKFCILLLIAGVLLSCLGDTDSSPTIYIHPDPTVTYHNNPSWLPETRIQFAVEFPNGLPEQAGAVIELNGVDITAEFDDWGVSQINVASLAAGGTYTAAAFPTVAATIRAGANTFQVRAPSEKAVIYFYADIQGAEIYITQWHDTYCGYSPSNAWLVPWKLHDDCVIDGSSGKIVNPDTQASRHAGAGVFVKGYLEANTAEGFALPWSLEINRYRIDNNGLRTKAAWNPAMNTVFNDGRWGDPTAGIPTGSGENQLYGYFGSDGAMCDYFLKYMINPETGSAYSADRYEQTSNLANNEFCAYFPDNDAAGNDMGAIEFVTTDNMGVTGITYLRSHVPIKDSRLDRNSPPTVVAGVGVRLGEETILAVLDSVSSTIELSGNLLPTPENIITLFGVTVRITELTLPGLDLDFSMPSTPGRLNVHTRIDGTEATVDGVANCNIFNLIVCLPLSAVLGGGITAIVSGDIYMQIDISVYDASHTTRPNEVYSNIAMDIPNMSIALDLGSGIGADILEAILNPLIGFLDAFIVNLIDGIVSNIVENIVIGFINNDIPKLRLALTSVDIEGQAYRQYLGLKPEIEYLSSSPSTYNVSEMGMDVELGFHTKANPRINKSPGALFDDNAELMQVRMARTVDGSNPASAGMAVSSNFINQLLMGLWEAGILGAQFNTGNNQSTNTFLNNVNVRFFSATPWTMDLIPPSDPQSIKGNAKVLINNLLISLKGDIYDPFRGRWYYDKTFLEMNVFLEAFVQISAQNGNIKIDFLSIPIAYLDEFNSEYIPATHGFVNGLLQDLMPLLANEVESMQVAIPEIIGMEIKFKDIWVEDEANLAVTFDITVD